jgi:NifB/MoaA-like Fe-S oxidoreductase
MQLHLPGYSGVVGRLKVEKLPGRIFIPSSMLRSGESVFLDDMTIDDAQRILGTEIIPVENDGRALIDKILKR